MKVGDITAVLEAFAPLRIQESWDNSGLIIGSPEDEVHGVLVGFDCTPALIDEAVEKGCDMVVTHHPLIFKGLKRIAPDDPVGAAVYLAIRHGIAIYAAHTNADKAPEGVNTQLILHPVIGIFAGVAFLMSACCQGRAAAAACDAYGETEKGFSNMITVIGIVETVALFALVFALLVVM